MKKIIIFITALTFASLLHAQDDSEYKTLFKNQQIHVSGFGGPLMSFSTIDGEFAHFMGGGGGVMINNFFIGGFGKGLTTSLPYKPDTDRDLDFGYGGFWLGYNFNSNKAIHPSLHTMLGWGSYSDRSETESFYSSENCFVIEPTLEIEMNVFEFFKLGLGASYRLVTLVDGAYTSQELSGPAAFLSFKFGWFSF